MRKLFTHILLLLLLLSSTSAYAQTDSLRLDNDSADISALKEFNLKLAEADKQRLADSVRKADLELQIANLKTSDNLQKEHLLKQLKTIEENELKRIESKKAQIDSLRKIIKGYPVVGIMKDTLLLIYSKIGTSTAAERAINITKKIEILYKDDFLNTDSIRVLKSENTFDIVYGELFVMSVSENDALWYNDTMEGLANKMKDNIKKSINNARIENSFAKITTRIALMLLVIAIAWLIFWLIGKAYTRLILYINVNKEKWLKDLSYKDYTFLSATQEMQIILLVVKGIRWIIYAILLYITLPIVFSIFPFSRNWANVLFNLIWSPLLGIITAVWNYLPNLFSILVIYTVMKYVIRFFKYIFQEIESDKLKISGFHPDWAMPTFSIIKFLLYAFMFVLIFQYLPASDSNIFKGVSVFIGILFSFGSSSAISNMIAGLIITYMRPFQLGDRIKIADISGDVIEKTLLVTRVKTVKNEIITIPNSSILTGNTINYTIEANNNKLIIYTTVTIGYDAPWRDVHKALIDAALKTDMILDNPKPFVLQTSLDDFYVSYQLNAYTHTADKQALIYSNIHQNIQDVFNERGIEIMSPHYRAARDGNTTTIPAGYLPADYTVPGFNVTIDKSDKKKKEQ